jgi:hypothetical protein
MPAIAFMTQPVRRTSFTSRFGVLTGSSIKGACSTLGVDKNEGNLRDGGDHKSTELVWD